MSDRLPDPLDEFQSWFDDAGEVGVAVPEAAVLATATPDGAPSARFVLVKIFDERGFAFHTNYESRKARDLAANPRAALVFYWRELGRQVRVEGRVRKVSAEESEAYFRTRPRGGQIAAWASRQSEPIESRDALDARFEEARARFEGGEVPLPEHWGGFRLVPETIEFWTHRDDRLHDRLVYRRSGTGWTRERLQP